MHEDNIQIVDTHESIREQNPFGTISTIGYNDEKKKKNLKMAGIAAGALFCLILLLIIILVVGKKVLAHPPLKWESPRLPTYAKPRHYNISLTLDEVNKVAQGVIVIDLELYKKTSLIVLHGDVQVSKAEARIINSLNDFNSNDKFVLADQITYDPVNDYILMRFDTLLKVPLYNGVTYVQLMLTFTSTFYNDNGIFITNFVDSTKTPVTAISTLFEPVYARTAFPCFDEPSYRTNITLELIANSIFTTFLSSTPIKSRSNTASSTTASFQTTPEIPVSSFGFFVSSLKNAGDKYSGVDIRVFSVQDKVPAAVAAVANVKKILTYYISLFQVNLLTPKLDIICLPNYAPKGELSSTSSLGLIIIPERDILMGDDSNTFSTRQNLLNLAREISNQWIGNIFSIKWWNSIWLLEGMDDFFQFLAVDHLNPNWNIWRSFHKIQQKSLFYDSLMNVNPLELAEGDVVTESDIEALTDEIIHLKGASVLNMMYDRMEAVEVGTFSNSISAFLKKYAYESVTTKDLWNVFQSTSQFAIVDFISDWTQKPGYPIISFETASNTSLTALQSPFYLYPSKTASQLWWVSLTLQYNTKLSAVSRIKFNHTVKSVAFAREKDNNYFVANPGRIGFYRVKYTQQMLDDVIQTLIAQGADQYQPEDIYSILYDILNIHRSSENSLNAVPIKNLFEITSLLSSSTDYSLWESLIQIYSDLEILLDYPGSSSAFYKFVESFTKNVLYTVGFTPFPDEDEETKILRSVVLPFAVKYNVDGCSVESYTMFRNLVENSTYKIDNDVKPSIYIAAAKYGNDDDYNWLKLQYKASTSNTDSLRLLHAMCHTSSADNLQIGFGMILSGDIRLRDVTLLGVPHQQPPQRHLAVFGDKLELFRQLLPLQTRIFRNQIIKKFHHYYPIEFIESSYKEVPTFHLQIVGAKLRTH